MRKSFTYLLCAASFIGLSACELTSADWEAIGAGLDQASCEMRATQAGDSYAHAACQRNTQQRLNAINARREQRRVDAINARRATSSSVRDVPWEETSARGGSKADALEYATMAVCLGGRVRTRNEACTDHYGAFGWSCSLEYQCY